MEPVRKYLSDEEEHEAQRASATGFELILVTPEENPFAYFLYGKFQASQAELQSAQAENAWLRAELGVIA